MLRFSKSRVPYEHQEQAVVIEWANLNVNQWPCLKYIYSSQSGVRMGWKALGREKKAGMKKGVPDLFLPFPTEKYHGLYIEMKRLKGGSVKPEQQDWINYLNSVGYYAVVCRGADEAIAVIKKYLRGGLCLTHQPIVEHTLEQ